MGESDEIDWDMVSPEAVMSGSRAQGANILAAAIRDIRLLKHRIAKLEGRSPASEQAGGGSEG
jgi:hypothetical protein